MYLSVRTTGRNGTEGRKWTVQIVKFTCVWYQSSFWLKNKAVLETFYCLSVRGNEKADLALVKNAWSIKHQICMVCFNTETLLFSDETLNLNYLCSYPSFHRVLRREVWDWSNVRLLLQDRIKFWGQTKKLCSSCWLYLQSSLDSLPQPYNTN